MVSMGEEKQQEQVPEERNAKERKAAGRETMAPNRRSAFRTLAAFYLAYLVYQLIGQIVASDVPGKALPWMIAAVAVFCAGAVWLIWPEVKHIKEVLDHVE